MLTPDQKRSLTRTQIKAIARCHGHFSAEVVALYFGMDAIVVELIWEITKPRPHLALVKDSEEDS